MQYFSLSKITQYSRDIPKLDSVPRSDENKKTPAPAQLKSPSKKIWSQSLKFAGRSPRACISTGELCDALHAMQGGEEEFGNDIFNRLQTKRTVCYNDFRGAVRSRRHQQANFSDTLVRNNYLGVSGTK
mmetsp:Transcript_27016/g.37593  ORF Transcript_27016/g.37593 Transcript_27016/m.37593 type:complete len:129 (+) Transcript_27016:121-507(+)